LACLRACVPVVLDGIHYFFRADKLDSFLVTLILPPSGLQSSQHAFRL
jgi:hypothetical protein